MKNVLDLQKLPQAQTEAELAPGASSISYVCYSTLSIGCRPPLTELAG